MNKLARNYLYNTAYQIFLIIVPLITAPYLTRVFSSETLGIYGYVNSIVSVLTTFGLLGLQSYGYRQIAYDRDDPESLNKSFSSIYELRLILLLIISVFYIPLVLLSDYKFYFLIQYALIVAQYIDISWLFIGLEELKIVSFRNFLAKFLTVIGIFIFVKNDNDLGIYFALFAIITLITAISVYPTAKKYVTFSIQKLRVVGFHILPAIKLFVPQIATILYLQFDKVMLKTITGSAAHVAYYDYAEKIINIPLAVITALSTVMMPRFANLHAQGNEAQLNIYLERVIGFALFLGTPMMFGMATIAEDFIPWYLGAEYTATSIAIIILCPVCIITALSNVLGAQYLSAINKTGVLSFAYYGAAAINIIGNALMIPKYGSGGAAMATTLCLLFSFGVQFLYVRRRVSFASLKKEAVKILFSGVMMFVVVRFVSSMLTPAPISTIVEILLGVVIYFFASLVLKVEMLDFIINKGKRVICRRVQKK